MKIFKLWIPVVAWAGIIFYFSGVSDLKTNLEYDFVLRKIAHIAEYFILTFLLYRAFRGSFIMNPLRLFMYAGAFALLYAIFDEVHQFFVLSRYCSTQDVLIDAIGIFAFYIIIRFTKGPLCLTK